MIREEKQRQLDALMEELADNAATREELVRHAAIVQAWLEGYDGGRNEGIQAASAGTLAALLPPEVQPPRLDLEMVEHAILDVLGTGPVPLEEIRKSFTWMHRDTDAAVGRLFEAGKIALGAHGYYRPDPVREMIKEIEDA